MLKKFVRLFEYCVATLLRGKPINLKTYPASLSGLFPSYLPIMPVSVTPNYYLGPSHMTLL